MSGEWVVSLRAVARRTNCCARTLREEGNHVALAKMSREMR